MDNRAQALTQQHEAAREGALGSSQIAPLLHDPSSRANLHGSRPGRVAPHEPRSMNRYRQLTNSFRFLLHSTLGAPALILAVYNSFLKAIDMLI